MSTFLHYVHCKDALLDCSAPGGERCESLTWVDEIRQAFCISVSPPPDGVNAHECWPGGTASLAPGGCGCYLLNHVEDRHLQRFLWNSPLTLDISRRWFGWCLTQADNKPLPLPMLSQSILPCGVTKPQWVNKDAKASVTGMSFRRRW